MNYLFYEDGGHGWLRIPKLKADKLGLPFTPFSYNDSKWVYLEEDCDMRMFIHRDGRFPHPMSDENYTDYLDYAKQFLSRIQRRYSHSSFIRDLESYHCSHYSAEALAEYWRNWRLR